MWRAGLLHTLSTAADGADYEPLDGFPADPQRWIRTGVAPLDGPAWVFIGGHALNDDVQVPAAWGSRDLSVWTVVDLPVPAQTDARAWALGHGSLGYVATGSGQIGQEGRLLTWLSDDGAAWRLSTIQPDGSIDAIVDGGAGLLAFGSTMVSGDILEGTGKWRFDVWRLEPR